MASRAPESIVSSVWSHGPYIAYVGHAPINFGLANVWALAARQKGKEAAILQVDLKDPDQQIGLFITKSCSEIGRVTSVKVFRSPSPFALIEMLTQELTHELASKLGGSSFGSCALIHLEQRPE